MISTALDGFTAPPSSRLLGWRLLDARSSDGWVRIGFDGKPEFCNPAGFIQGGILSAMLDDTMGPAVFVMLLGGFVVVGADQAGKRHPRRSHIGAIRE